MISIGATVIITMIVILKCLRFRRRTQQLVGKQRAPGQLNRQTKRVGRHQFSFVQSIHCSRRAGTGSEKTLRDTDRSGRPVVGEPGRTVYGVNLGFGHGLGPLRRRDHRRARPGHQSPARAPDTNRHSSRHVSRGIPFGRHRRTTADRQVSE